MATASIASWSTPFPQAAIAVAGGPLTSFERDHGQVVIRALLHSTSAAHAPRLLDAVASYLDLYQPLLGAYPFRELTIVENFFSSGFAYPGFTLLSSQVVEMGERGLRPGHLDHELLHEWWGNGVLGARRSGLGGGAGELLRQPDATGARRPPRGDARSGARWRRP